MSETATEPKAERRWYQYSIASLMIFVTVACLVMGLISWCSHPRVAYRRAVAPLVQLGGNVDGRPVLGPDSVTYAFFNERPLTDDDLKTLKEPLGNLPNLEWLTLFSPKITNSGLEHLKGLSNLKTLCLFHTQLTDDGLEQLKGLTNLKTLCLSGSQITDAGLEHLKAMTHLKDLGLDETGVTDEGIEELQQALPNCNIHH